VTLELPPLRRRGADLPPLIEQFLARWSQRTGRPAPAIDAEALALLLDHDYPGNVRELENLIERACVLSADGHIGPDHLPDHLRASAPRPPAADSLAAAEADALQRALDAHGGNRLATALHTLSGPLHGGACDRIEDLVDSLDSPLDADALVGARLQRGEAVPGFGHPLYPDGDPRARLLLPAAEEVVRRKGRIDLQKVTALCEAMEARGHPPPAADLALVALTRALGLPRGTAGALFALGRSAGWIGHVLEERERATLVRPRARYRARDVAP